MAEVIGAASWALDDQQQPALERERTYQKEHAKLLAEISY